MVRPRPERRQNHRVMFPLEIRYRATNEMLGMWHEATMLDVSAGGLRLHAQQPLEPSERVELRIQLPLQQQPYLVRGRVVWRHETPAGVEHGVVFDADPDNQVKLDELVHFLMRQPPAP